jgi:hypothetical protein
MPSQELETLTHWAFATVECCMTLEDIDWESISSIYEELRKKMMPKELLEEKDETKLSELFKAWSETEDGKKFNAIPALLLIDPDGKVLLSNPSMDELAEKIEELRR